MHYHIPTRPSFSKDGFYSGYDINGMYTQNSQKEVDTDYDDDYDDDDEYDDYDDDHQINSVWRHWIWQIL